jgi:hypothetical protein
VGKNRSADGQRDRKRERKRGKQERECGLLHRVVTDENRRRTAQIPARNSSPMATSPVRNPEGDGRGE